MSQYSISYLNNIAKVALKLCSIFEIEIVLIRQILTYFRPLIVYLLKKCRKQTILTFDPEKHEVTKVKVPKILLQNFERVRVAPSIWEAVSVALFEDGATEVLKLVALVTFLQFEVEFREQIENSTSDSIEWHQTKVESFEALVGGLLGSDVTLNYYHLMALSAGIRKPIYLFGSFEQFRNASVGVAPDPAQSPYDLARSIYEDMDSVGHFRFCGLEADDSGLKEAVCLVCDSDKISCVLLPREGSKEKAWRPKNLAGYYLDAKEKPIRAKIAVKTEAIIENLAAATIEPKSTQSEANSEAKNEANTAEQTEESSETESACVPETSSASAPEPRDFIAPAREPELTQNLKSSASNSNACPKCQNDCFVDTEACLGSCDDCEFIFCINCGNNYHGVLISCDMTEKEQKEMIQLHEESKELEIVDRICQELEKAEREQLIAKSQVTGLFGSDGDFLFECKACNVPMTKHLETVEGGKALFSLKGTVFYFKCLCPGFVRLQKKKVDKWAKKAKDDFFTISFERNEYFVPRVLKR